MPKRVLARQDCCCCRPYFIGQLLNPSDPPDPPVLSEYCVYWASIPVSLFYPCVEGFDVNGNTSQGELCGNYFFIADFQEAGNSFFYGNTNSNNWYAHIIKPAANAVPVDLGYYEFLIFGEPSGQLPIDIQESNCFVNCYTATFDVDDVDTDGFTGLIYNDGQTIDLTILAPFSDPDCDADTLAQIIGFLEPSATFTSSYVGNTVTIIITTIMNIEEGVWGDSVVDKGEINFTPCT